MKLTINPKLSKCIPPLSEDEFKTLEKSILKEGCRDAIIVWDKTIVDGHNRYKICQEHGIDFETVEHPFASMDTAKIWIIDNQNGRRNLTDGWKWELAQEKRKLLIEKGTKKISTTVAKSNKTRMKDSTLSTNDKPEKTRMQDSTLLETNKPEKTTPEPKHDTREKLAKDLGWGTSKVAQATKVWKEADEKTKERIKKGDESIHGAYQKLEEVKRKKRRKKVIKNEPKPVNNFERLKKHALALADGLQFWADKTMIPESEDEATAAHIVRDAAASIVTHYGRLGIDILGIYETFIDPQRRVNENYCN